MPVRPPATTTPGTTARRPPTASPDSSYTDAIRKYGLAGINDARRSHRYGTDSIIGPDGAPTGNPYQQAPTTQNDLYDQWLSQVTPQGYDVAFGRTPTGKYAGFDQLSTLQAATLGKANAIRDQDEQRFSALDQMANEGLDQVDTDYTKRRSAANLQDWTRPAPASASAAHTSPNGWSTAAGMDPLPTVDPVGHESEPRKPGDSIVDAVVTASQAGVNHTPALARQANPEAASRTIGDYGRKSYMANELNPWLAQEGGKLLEQQDFAQQGLSTPLSAYAARAGAEYGIDPNVIAGWYSDEVDIADFEDQRNLDTLDATGMPYADYNTALDHITSQRRGARAAWRSVDRGGAWASPPPCRVRRVEAELRHVSVSGSRCKILLAVLPRIC